jgi:hypothetical protein
LRVFKNAWFGRFARKQKIPDAVLRHAVERIERGQIDADLGGGVVKQRIARPGKGKSKGFRTIILLRQSKRAVFVYGFAKGARENIRKDEEETFKLAAKYVLALSDEQIEALIANGQFSEVASHDQGEEVSE